MKLGGIALAITLVCFALYEVFRVVSVVGPRFSFSCPLSAGINEVRANLPSGRYVLILSTNTSENVFSMPPQTPDYRSSAWISIRTDQRTLIEATNAHHQGFRVEDIDKGTLHVTVNIATNQIAEVIQLHLGRSF